MEGIGVAMEVLKLITKIEKVVSEVKHFKHRSQCLEERIELFRPSLDKLASGKMSKVQTEDSLQIFSRQLGSVLNLFRKVESFLKDIEQKNFLDKTFYRDSINKRFTYFSEQLLVHAQAISLALAVEGRELSIPLVLDSRQDEEDIRKDLDNLKSSLQKELDDLKDRAEKSLNLSRKQENVDVPMSWQEQTLDKVDEIPIDDISSEEKISDGRYGTAIYKAKYKNEWVALKTFPKWVEEVEFFREVKNLVRLNSPHIVRLWGSCKSADSYSLVMEYLGRGNLRAVLQSVAASELSQSRRVQMALDGALGLYRIHNMAHPMLLLDFGSDKFLVGNNWEVKIFDVGMAKTYTTLQNRSAKSGAVKSTVTYISPECLEEAVKADERSEIYSFGVVMWEIATGLRPYIHENGEAFTDKEITSYVTAGKKLPRPENCPELFMKLIYKCLDSKPILRPTTNDLVSKLHKILELLSVENA